ncbi:MAG TPA: molecular chaperone Hsp90, partial [Pseudonocardia sp.]
AVGVLDSFALVHDEQPSGPDHDLADEELWWDSVGEQDQPGPLVAIRDLDLVADDAWPATLELLAGDPRFRPALRAQPGRPEPYTRWWLAGNARLDGQRPGYWRLPGASALAGLYDPVRAEVAQRVDPELLAAIGVRSEVRVADRRDAADLLARLGDPARRPDAALIWRVHDELAASVLAGRVDPADLDPPEWLRARDGSVVDAGEAVLLDGIWLAVALPPAETVAGRLDPDGVDALAELFDLPLASEVVAGRVVDPAGEPVDWASLPEVVAGCAAMGIPVPAGGLIKYPTLTVRLTRPTTAEVPVPVWWQDGDWHAADPVRALLAMLARADR